MADEYKKVIKEKKNEAKKLMSDDQMTKCNIAIHGASVAAATAAFVPLPGVDAVPITGAQITMVLSLGKIFDQKISKSVANGIISAAASTLVGRSLVKLIPIAGWAASSAVAAAVTEAIGWTIAVDFANQYANKNDSEADVINDIINNSPTVSFDDLDDATDIEMKDSGVESPDENIIQRPDDDTDIIVSEEKMDDESLTDEIERFFDEEE